MAKLNDKSRIEAEQIIKNEISVVTNNPSIIGKRCRLSCVVQNERDYAGSQRMSADLVSERGPLDNEALNHEFISMVQEIHMKARMMGADLR